MERTLAERRALLRSVVEPVPGMFFLAEATEASDVGGLTHAMATAVGAHCEGLMVKALHGESSKYEAGKRSLHWLKLKEDYLQGANRTGLGDTIDLVPVAAYWGAGKRAGTYGAYLMASYNDESRKWEPVCKLGSGFDEAQLAQFTSYFKSQGADASSPAAGASGSDGGTGGSGGLVEETTKSANGFDADAAGELAADAGESGRGVPVASAELSEDTQYLLDLTAKWPKNLRPHKLLRPDVVWEVRATSISLSPVFRAGADAANLSKGLSLRFPRFVRERPDKAAVDATTSSQLASMFAKQADAADLSKISEVGKRVSQETHVEEVESSGEGRAKQSERLRREILSEPAIEGPTGSEKAAEIRRAGSEPANGVAVDMKETAEASRHINREDGGRISEEAGLLHAPPRLEWYGEIEGPGRSRRFWCARLDGSVLSRRWGDSTTFPGKRGTAKDFACAQLAEKHFNRAVAEKMRRGYVPVENTRLGSIPPAQL